MKTHAGLCVLAVVAGACGGGASTSETAVLRPVVSEQLRRTDTTSVPIRSCPGWLLRPRDNTRFTLARSFLSRTGSTLGDYRPDRPVFDIGPRELLRVDCSTLRSESVVRDNQ